MRYATTQKHAQIYGQIRDHENLKNMEKIALRDNALTGNLVSIKVGNLVSLSKMQNLIA